MLLEHVGDLLAPRAHVVEGEGHHRRGAGEQRGQVRGGPAEAGIAGDRGFVNRDGVDEETTVADHAALGGKGGTHQRARERRPVVEQGGHLRGHRPAHGRVDLLEHRARRETGVEAPSRITERGGRHRIGKHAGLGVDGDHWPIVVRKDGRDHHRDRSRAREQAARVAGAGEVVRENRHRGERRRRHECITLP